MLGPYSSRAAAHQRQLPCAVARRDVALRQSRLERLAIEEKEADHPLGFGTVDDVANAAIFSIRCEQMDHRTGANNGWWVFGEVIGLARPIDD